MKYSHRQTAAWRSYPPPYRAIRNHPTEPSETTRRRALLSVEGEGVEAKAAAAGPSWGQLEGRKEEAGRDGGGVRRAMPGMMEALGRTGARQLRWVRRRVSGEAGLDRRLALELGLEGVAEEGEEQDEGEDYGVHVGHGGLYDVYEEL
ncbi:hypothetical protein CHLRE_17g713575v5 [Chlamydomonas reinhardtii]|uniref:Uncharacterized protein n=1 Tax=Chlamydomonas reinhardtii TaxID=3055 RepID=A0A2K3CPT1_CHLRE|nr:uncharacterized protein CHLRE_17g713575v5 [Chlamydomonas reinhardtii]PNW70287.1 hypothetical protein CHLRE_17g713575v5 [Chlamydomonas reinhardtii]